MSVRVHPGSRREEVQRLHDGSLEVWTHEPASEGRANEDVCRLIAAFLDEPSSSVRVVRGARSRLKLVEVPDSS